MDCSPPGFFVIGFPRQEYWNVLPFPTPGDLPGPGMESMAPALAGGATRECQWLMLGHVRLFFCFVSWGVLVP